MKQKRFFGKQKVGLTNRDIIKSISYSQQEMIKWIMYLYCPYGFDLDVTYSKGNFYKGLIEPKIKMDITPIKKDVIKSDAKFIPIKDTTLSSIMFDPPFIIGGTSKSKIKSRFDSFSDCQSLYNLYYLVISESFRILKAKGIFVFKCQDGGGGKCEWAHLDIINYATNIGFIMKDLFVLLAKNRLIRQITQTKARKYHSYFLVFEKEKGN